MPAFTSYHSEVLPLGAIGLALPEETLIWVLPMGFFHHNGLLVQGELYSWIMEQNASYRGVGCGQPWPLDDPVILEKDRVARSLTARTEQFFPQFEGNQFAAFVVSDLGFVREYRLHCGKIGIKTRVVLCMTNLHLPYFAEGEGMTSDARFVGFDYAPSSCDFSILADDLNGEEIPELSAFKVHLNPFGLFSTESQLQAYIRARQMASLKGMNIEKDNDCICFKLYEIANYSESLDP